MSNFRPLARGMTFDTRSRVDSHDAGYFKPLTRSMTWVGGKTNDSGSDVRYRRFFNTSEEQQIRQRLEHRTTISRYRGESFDRDPSVHKHRNQCVVVTDTFSSGQLLASLLYHQGYSIVRLLSADLKELLDFAPDGATCEFIKSLAVDTDKDYESEIEAIIRGLNDLPFPIVAVIAGAETGVELADEISERLGLPLSNGTALSEARRNKFVMGETVRASGVRAVKQLKASSWGEIEIFLAEWQPSPFKVIVKPLDSAGSDDVTLCCSLGEVQAAFGNIMGKVNGLGLVNSFVLVQEYLEGQEYVIDTVSLEGQHKVVAIWAYDRRPANGAHFVCRGQRLLTADEPYCHELIEYQKKVLDALGIKNGPAHGEVKWFRGEPVLVEVGARCHGGDGFWTTVCDEVYGYNQAQVAIDAYLNAETFARIPDAPLVRHAFGRLLFICVRSSGVLVEVCKDFVEEIESMSSFLFIEIFHREGKRIRPTIDCFTFGGLVKLVNKDLTALLKDYERIQSMEEDPDFFRTSE